MDAKNKRMLLDIKIGRTPSIIESVDSVFIADYVSKYSVHGYVCGLIGDYESKHKQVNIQKTKSGERYVVADRKRFNLDLLQPCGIRLELVEKELTTCRELAKMYVTIKADGIDIGYSLENEEFYIKNLSSYLEGRASA
jgi:hypothetical protein